MPYRLSCFRVYPEFWTQLVVPAGYTVCMPTYIQYVGSRRAAGMAIAKLSATRLASSVSYNIRPYIRSS